MAIAQISVIIFIFTLLFIIFSYSRSDYKIGVWIVIILIFTLILGFMTSNSDFSKERVHPSYLVAKYSKYNVS